MRASQQVRSGSARSRRPTISVRSITQQHDGQRCAVTRGWELGVRRQPGRSKPDPGRVEQLRQLAKCMREHGVTNYPDPAADGSMQIGGQSGLNPEDPTFKAAEQACAQYRPAAPSGGTMTKGNG